NGSTPVLNQTFTLDRYGNVAKSGDAPFQASYGTTGDDNRIVTNLMGNVDFRQTMTRTGTCSTIQRGSAGAARGKPGGLRRAGAGGREHARHDQRIPVWARRG